MTWKWYDIGCEQVS